MSAENLIQAKLGETVTVEVSAVSANPGAPKTVKYTGTILKSERWDPPETFRMTGTEMFPTRVIAYNNVRSLDGTKAETVQKRTSQLVRIRSSKGDKDYVVTLNLNGMHKCTCQGFGIRKTCRHLGEAIEQVKWSA